MWQVKVVPELGGRKGGGGPKRTETNKMLCCKMGGSGNMNVIARNVKKKWKQTG